MDVCIVFISSLRFVSLKLSLVVELFFFFFLNRCVYSAFSSMVRIVISHLVFRATVSIQVRSSAGHLVKCLQWLGQWGSNKLSLVVWPDHESQAWTGQLEGPSHMVGRVLENLKGRGRLGLKTTVGGLESCWWEMGWDLVKSQREWERPGGDVVKIKVLGKLLRAWAT